MFWNFKFVILVVLLLLFAGGFPAVTGEEIIVGYKKSQLTFEDTNQTQPVYSPDGKKIVYLSKGANEKYFEIWIMNSDGSNHEQLTDHDFSVMWPQFSHDGKKIVYNEFRTYKYHIWIKDGGDNRNLTGGSYEYVTPYFHPDNSRIMYSSNEDGGDWFDIWTMDLNGENREQLTNESVNQLSPHYNSNGTKILYLVNDDETLISLDGDLWLMDSEGNNQEKIVDGGEFGCRDLDYHPDDSKVMYMKADVAINGGFSQIYMEDLNGTGKERLTNIARNIYYPSLDPDGTGIIYASYEDEGKYLDFWLMDLTEYETTDPPIPDNDDDSIDNGDGNGNTTGNVTENGDGNGNETDLNDTIPGSTNNGTSGVNDRHDDDGFPLALIIPVALVAMIAIIVLIVYFLKIRKNKPFDEEKGP